MIVINWGGGTNSTALIIEALNRGIRPDLIMFSDPGAEMPHTKLFKEEFCAWLALRGLHIEETRWERVRGERAGFIPIDEACLLLGDLPSAAYRKRGCSTKYKGQPIDAYVNRHPLTVAARARGETIERWLGYDDDEDTRGRDFVEQAQGSLFPSAIGKWKWRAPLQEWHIDRARCVEIIKSAGLSQPGKSSCYFCPFMKKAEIFYLKENHPDLFAKALAIEDNARPNLTSIKGLGGSFSWRDLTEGKECDAGFSDSPCGCFDDSEPEFSFMERSYDVNTQAA